MRVIGGILVFIGIIGILGAKGGSRDQRGERALYGVVFLAVGGIILASFKDKDEKPE